MARKSTENVVGQVFNYLTILGDAGRDEKGNRLVETQCVCGNIITKPLHRLKSGHVKSCSCKNKPLRRPKKRVDGKKLGETIVFGDIGSDEKGQRIVLIRCGHCKRIKKRLLYLLKKTNSCGCTTYADHVGKEYGWWTVLEAVGRRHNQQLVQCRCRCGFETPLLINSLTQGNSTCCRMCAGIKRRKDYTGLQFGNWYIFGDAGYKNGARRVWCRCGCRKEAIRYLSSLQNGTSKSCNCSIRANYIGRRFGEWLVLASVGKTARGHQLLRCQCDCGTEREVESDSLIKGRSLSCGCPINYTGMEFGLLTVLRMVGRHESRGTQMLECQCECGKTCVKNSDSLVQEKAKSCGCLTSWKEEVIRRWLDEHGYTYQRQYTFEDCKHKQLLPFDFAVFKGDKIYLIEYHGPQHDEDYKGIMNAKKTQHNDLIKQAYCEHYGVPILYLDKTYRDITHAVEWFLESEE